MKKTILLIILGLIFLIIFNTVFFLTGGTEHNISVWISYGFIHFAYFMLFLTPILIRKGKSSSIFGVALYAISTAYFIVAFVTGVIFILIAANRINATILIQLCIAGLYGIILIANLLANERTADAEEKRQYEVKYVKEASAKLKGILDRISDEEAKKKVERVYDTVYSSPVKSDSNLTIMESNIMILINNLEHAVIENDTEQISVISDTVLVAVNERNRSVKSLN